MCCPNLAFHSPPALTRSSWKTYTFACPCVSTAPSQAQATSNIQYKENTATPISASASPSRPPRQRRPVPRLPRQPYPSRRRRPRGSRRCRAPPTSRPCASGSPACARSVGHFCALCCVCAATYCALCCVSAALCD